MSTLNIQKVSSLHQKETPETPPHLSFKDRQQTRETRCLSVIKPWHNNIFPRATLTFIDFRPSVNPLALDYLFPPSIDHNLFSVERSGKKWRFYTAEAKNGALLKRHLIGTKDYIATQLGTSFSIVDDDRSALIPIVLDGFLGFLEACPR